MHLYHMANSADQNSSCNPTCNHEAEDMARTKIPIVILFCKHAVLYIILHTECGLVVKSHSALFIYILLPQKPI